MTHRPTDPFSATAAPNTPADTTARRPRVAVIGTGISGMGAAYLLHTATTDTGAPRFDVTIYEKNAYIGGHSRTIDVPINREETPKQAPEKQPVDTGFIVLNDRNYPNLLGLFRHLGVAIEKSDMSFGARIDSAATSARNTPLEYGSKNLFAQKSNLFRPKFWGMIVDILRFNRSAGKILKDAEKDPSLHNKTMGQYIKDLDMGAWFRDYYLLAMGAAIWSCPATTMLDFPATTFIRFFENHGLLTINGHPQWYTVTGGSRAYVAKLTAAYKGHIRLNCGVVSVAQAKDGAKDGTKILRDSQGNDTPYDLVVFACHADEALAMIAEPDASEQSILGAFRYQENRVVVHTDASFMPRNKGAWASWVYLSDDSNAARKSSTVSLSYWMNNLQNFTSRDPVLVTLNPHREPRKNSVLDEHVFSHPVFDRAAIAAQGKTAALQGHNGFYYCGAYQQYGFHEDGILSAVRMAATMGITPPWA